MSDGEEQKPDWSEHMRFMLLVIAAIALVGCASAEKQPELFTIDKGCNAQRNCYSTVIVRRPNTLEVALCNVGSSEPAPGGQREAGAISCQRQTIPQGVPFRTTGEWWSTIPEEPAAMESGWGPSFWRLQRTQGNWWLTYCVLRFGVDLPPTCSVVGGPLW
jgi:hypothetical protein